MSLQSSLVRALCRIGDQFERGVPCGRCELGPFENACYATSQALFRLAWRLHDLGAAPK